MPKYTAAQKRAYAKRMKAKRNSAQSKFKLRRPRASVVNQLQPILETKKFTSTGITETALGIVEAADVIVPTAYVMMNRDRDVTGDAKDSAMDGRDIFSRYLTMKVEVTYPHGSDGPAIPCRPVKLIWGWCNPMNLTEFTTPTKAVVTLDQIIAHVNQSVATDYNDNDDPMKFPDKKRRLYNIIGTKDVMPNLNRQLPHAIPAGSWADSAMPLQYAISWPTKKKVRYQHTVPGYPTPEFCYPNEGYIPFVIAYNQDHAAYRADSLPENVRQVHLRLSSCHWFNDA